MTLGARIRHRLRSAAGKDTRPAPSRRPSAAALRPYASLLPTRSGQTVVILADGGAGAAMEPLLGTPPTGRVVVVSAEARPEWVLEAHGAEHRPAQTLAEVNAALARLGPVDVLHDLVARSAGEYDETWRTLFLHLRPRGAYLLHRGRAPEPEIPPSILECAATVGMSADDLREGDYARRPLRLAVRSVTVSEDHVVVLKRGKHVWKTREDDANEVLPQREPELVLTELATVPGGMLDRRPEIHSHVSGVEIRNLPGDMEYPTLHLRHYQGAIAMASNALLHTGFTALPDSFRHHRSRWSRNPRLIDAGPDFARTRPMDRPRETLAGSYYHLDSENSGHYGHLMTEVVGRLWGWDQARQAVPDLRAIFRVKPGTEPTLEKRIFTAFGIAPEEMVWVDHPVRLESVVAGTPMWHNLRPHYVHPGLLEVWDRIRESFLDQAAQSPTTAELTVSGGRRIFVSRKELRWNRTCRNTREVEDFFAERGFDVVYPELHDLAHQAEIFAGAEVIAGFGGSAMFNAMFNRNQPTVILLSHEAYTARNEHLFSALIGGQLHYFWSTPDVQHPERGWSEQAYYSSWEFDFERNAGDLTTLIETLS